MVNCLASRLKTLSPNLSTTKKRKEKKKKPKIELWLAEAGVGKIWSTAQSYSWTGGTSSDVLLHRRTRIVKIISYIFQSS